ncbi:MAG: hypothetical protein HQL77_05080 [Magnetococcales bacterium]|nr:hypothetical protein [Magnetococcales bacterium]
MRVTQTMMYTSGAVAMQSQQQDLQKLQENTTTGKRISRPSDDPTGSFRDVLFSADLSGVQSLQKTTDTASQRLNLADTQVGQMFERLLDAKDLALQMGNSETAGNPDILKAQGESAKAIYQDILKNVNTETDGTPIFSGSRTRSPYDAQHLQTTSMTMRSNGKGTLAPAPTGIKASVVNGQSITDLPMSVKMSYQAATGEFKVDVNGVEQPPPKQTGTSPTVLDLGNGLQVSVDDAYKPAKGDVYYFEVIPQYQGGVADRPVKVLNGQTLPGNVTGKELLEGTGPIGRNVNVLGAIAALRGALLRADPDEIHAQVDRLQEAGAQVSDLQAVTGVRVTLIDAVSKTLSTDSEALSTAKATNSEADVLGLISELTQKSQNMQVLTATERQILNTSLLDFIR